MADIIVSLFAALGAFTWLQWLCLIGALLASPLIIMFVLSALMFLGESVRWIGCLVWTFWGFVLRVCSWQDVKEAFADWAEE